MNHVLYLYGFLASDSPAPPVGVTGIAGRPVRVVDLGSFRAAVSELDGREYRQGALEQQLKDLSWVAEHGARHETVVTWFADHGTILPARLFTVFSSEDALRAEATERADGIRDRLVRFRDLREWDLKVSYDLDALLGHLGEFSDQAAAVEADLKGAAPGRRYLLERKREEVGRRQAGEIARRVGDDLLRSLAVLAEEVRELELPVRRDDFPVVLNAALLVSSEKVGELQSRASHVTAGLEGKGIHAALTGPWAPYRFVTEEVHG